MRITPSVSAFALALIAGAIGTRDLLAQATTPTGPTAAPSTRATAAVSITLPRRDTLTPAPPPLRIRIDYGQPHLRGRTLHTPTLVPYDSIWRTGANEATTLETDVDLQLGSATIPKGKYALWALPTRTEWKLIVSRNVGANANTYDATQDLVRIPLRARTLRDPIESLAIVLIPATNVQSPRGELRITWGTVELTTDWLAK